mgnify:CR=1 FL=1
MRPSWASANSERGASRRSSPSTLLCLCHRLTRVVTHSHGFLRSERMADKCQWWNLSARITRPHCFTLEERHDFADFAKWKFGVAICSAHWPRLLSIVLTHTPKCMGRVSFDYKISICSPPGAQPVWSKKNMTSLININFILLVSYSSEIHLFRKHDGDMTYLL